MSLNTTTIIKLREATGAGIGDCQKALEEGGGDMDKAIEILRKNGAIKAAKKISERTTKEGIVEAYIHATKKAGSLVEVRCETDFVAKTNELKELAHDIAMHIVAVNPLYLIPENIPYEIIEKEKEIYTEQLKKEKKPEHIIDKIIEGKLQKFYTDVCLMRQPFVKDETKTIEDLVKEKISKTGEKIEIAKFCSFKI